MQFGQDFEKIFFRLSLDKPKYLQSIKTDFYQSEEIDILSYLANKFYVKFNETPTKDQLKLLVQNSKRAKEKVTDGILDLLFEVDLDQYDEEWLTDTAESWIKWRTFNTSLTDTIEFIKTTQVTPENTESIIQKVKGLINDRNNITFNSDLGLEFFDPDAHDQKETEKVSSGYNFVDRLLGGGYDKGGNLVVYAGEQNIGKSIYLANDAANFVKMGTNTVVITAEMEAHKFVKRIGSNMLSINISEYSDKSKNRDLMKRKLETVGDGFTPPGQLFIKQMPTSQATVLDIESYISQVEEEKQIKIGAVVVDYINILANYRNPNTENTYMKIKQIAEDLRAMGQRNSWLVVTATQITRSGYNSSDITMSDVAESAGLSHTADVMYGIIQDDLMRANEEYWLKILKIRDGEGKGTKCRLNIIWNYMRLVESEDLSTSNIHGI
jgi:KaiC/GvpD/RAD55 family RecA-like ATPase